MKTGMKHKVRRDRKEQRLTIIMTMRVLMMMLTTMMRRLELIMMKTVVTNQMTAVMIAVTMKIKAAVRKKSLTG